MNRLFDFRAALVALAVALAIALAWHCAAPRSYVATARVLLPHGGAQSRIVKLESEALDPADARSRLSGLLRRYAGASLVDGPATVPARRSLALDLALGGVLGLGCGAGVAFWTARRRRPGRMQRDLVPLLGNPLVAARPMRPEALRALAETLQAHWFTGARKLLPIVSAGRGDGRSRVAVQLAQLFASMGERTLLIDADFRSPSLHRAFQLKNEGGLADLLADRPVRLAAGGENLAVLVAGRGRAEPLELLSRARLRTFLDAAAHPFSIVLIDTPAAQSGPDLEIFAAVAGGALLVVRPGEDAARLSRLRRQLTRCNALPVASIFNRR